MNPTRPQTRPLTRRQGHTEKPQALFLPNFCGAPAIIEILIIAEVVAMILTMARGLQAGANVLQDFIAISLFMLWLALASAAVLCIARKPLANARPRNAYLICYVLLLLTTVLVSALGIMLDQWQQLGLIEPGYAGAFLSRNLSISAIVSALALRYFHVQYQWKRQIERQADSRIESLQARIRPHFLFNSMNTIAALIELKPDVAEQAVHDLADLFRASLTEARKLVDFEDEVELAQLYLRLETLRLEDRLQVDWDIDAVPAGLSLPRLTLQPLLENAIYHGIEPSPEGGRISIAATVSDDKVELCIRNPVVAHAPRRDGFHIALDNTRERLHLALGNTATLDTLEEDGWFEARIVLPRGNS
jgi:two-component system sensor histidine kinase AlgZ